jgi:hypothetical protein
MELFNGIILPDNKRVPFPHPVSPKVTVQAITIRNHPAYNRKGDAKQLTAKTDIAEGSILALMAVTLNLLMPMAKLNGDLTNQ